MDLLTEIEEWFFAVAQSPSPFSLTREDVNYWLRKFDERAKAQAQMRANVESMRASGERVITRLNREAKRESELD